MVTLEQKVDLLMRYAAATCPEESNRLHEEICKMVSDFDATPESSTDISSRAKNDILMDGIIRDLLRDLGSPCHLIGYEQAVYAIKLVISDRKYLEKITLRLYPEIAKKFNNTPSRAERAIRHLVETAWIRHDTEDAFRIFGNTINIDRGKPTNSEFIAACAVTVKRRMREQGVDA